MLWFRKAVRSPGRCPSHRTHPGSPTGRPAAGRPDAAEDGCCRPSCHPGFHRRGRRATTLVAPGVAAVAGLAAVPATATLTAGALVAVDLRVGVPEARADLVDLELHDGALLAFLGLVGAALQTAADDHAHALGQGFCDVLGSLTPDRSAKEQGLPVLPFIRLAVKGPRGGSNGEVRNGRTGRRETQFGVVGQIANNGDWGFACHLLPPWGSCEKCGGPKSRRITLRKPSGLPDG